MEEKRAQISQYLHDVVNPFMQPLVKELAT